MLHVRFGWGMLLSALVLAGCDPEKPVEPILTITQITPGMTQIGGNTLNTALIGDTLTIQGESFSPVAAENQVTVQGVATPVLTASLTRLTTVVPASTPLAYVLVHVARTGYQSAEQQISVRSVPSPVITGIRPTSGPVGSVVTIRGKHLLGTLEAHLLAFPNASGQAARVLVGPFTPLLATADSIQLQVPAGAGTGRITLYARAAENVKNAYGSVVTPLFTVTP